jgi:hypothetical protein
VQLSKVLQGTGVTAVALHPGWVDSNLGQYAIGSQKSCTYAMLKPILKMAGMLDTWGGTQTTLFCILDDSITTHSGEYYSRGGIYTREKQRCKKGGWPMKSPSPHVTDENAGKLWAVTEEMVARFK